MLTFVRYQSSSHFASQPTEAQRGAMMTPLAPNWWGRGRVIERIMAQTQQDFPVFE